MKRYMDKHPSTFGGLLGKNPSKIETPETIAERYTRFDEKVKHSREFGEKKGYPCPSYPAMYLPPNWTGDNRAMWMEY